MCVPGWITVLPPTHGKVSFNCKAVKRFVSSSLRWPLNDISRCWRGRLLAFSFHPLYALEKETPEPRKMPSGSQNARSTCHLAKARAAGTRLGQFSDELTTLWNFQNFPGAEERVCAGWRCGKQLPWLEKQTRKRSYKLNICEYVWSRVKANKYIFYSLLKLPFESFYRSKLTWAFAKAVNSNSAGLLYRALVWHRFPI